ncbi:MAG: MerR family transcriptional regulator [Helicobacteraceae bacterium CG2_30_36_10]|nr:MAG: MerR family transcriptional regulator [Helicobacteraceae bacterium CG2_30_36_10]
MMHHYDEPVYLISIVAKILDIHPQTLRQYERENLVCPSRSDGRIRLYSQRDIDRIKLILRLTRELGVNLAGVDIILRLKVNVDEMEQGMAELKQEVAKAKKSYSVSPNKALVTKKSIYEMIIFKE